MTRDEIAAILERVPLASDSYISGILADIDEFGTGSEIVEFIKENPEANIGQVATYSTKLAGII